MHPPAEDWRVRKYQGIDGAVVIQHDLDLSPQRLRVVYSYADDCSMYFPLLSNGVVPLRSVLLYGVLQGLEACHVFR